MRYKIALAVSIVLIGAGALFAHFTFQSIEAKVREKMRQMQEAGKLPPELQGIDVATADISQMQVKLPSGDMDRLELANFLFYDWYILAPLVLAICFGIAALLKRRGGA